MRNLSNCFEQAIVNKELKKTKLKSVIFWTTPFGKNREKIGNIETNYILDSNCSFNHF